MEKETEKNVDETQEEVQDEEIQDEVQDEEKSQEELEAESKKSIVDKIKTKIAGFKKPAEKTEDLDEEIDIPDKFTKAALENDWTEEEIIEFASDYDDDKDLLEMIPYLFEDEKEDKEDEKDKGKKEEKEDEDGKKIDEKTDRDKLKEEIRNELLKEFGTLKQSLDDAKKEKKDSFVANLTKEANDVFDKASEEFEVFGKTEELPKFPAGRKKGQLIPTSPAYKARNEVFTSVLLFIKGGLSTKEAMENAMSLYKGKHLEKDVKRNLIKGLKKSEKRLSAKRTAKDTKKEFKSESEEKVAIVEDVIKNVIKRESH